MAKPNDAELSQYVNTVTHAIRSGQLPPRAEDAAVVAELMSAPQGVFGVIDVSQLSEAAQKFARMVGMVLQRHTAATRTSSVSSLSIEECQLELFRLFRIMFTALIGVGPDAVSDVEELQQRLVSRYQQDYAALASGFNTAAAELEAFYRQHATTIYAQAKQLGGVKLVLGGQRAFGNSALNSVRISSLYADTQLIPDPVYPYLSGEMHLNAMHLQLAHALYFTLHLEPLVLARLPVPPVVVFPSFELELEEHDVNTKLGLADLALQLLAPVCEGTFESLDDIFDYVRKHEDRFMVDVMRERLFVPPGSSPAEQLSPEEALRRYMDELKGVRHEKMLEQMRSLPRGVLLLNGVLERLRPQYHLYENSEELDAQPLLSQEAQWHYYEKCAQASAKGLVRKHVLSEQSYQTLRALQDVSLGWLATIPIAGLVELNRQQEHKLFRKELKDYTAQITSVGPADLDKVVREVNHGLADMVTRHQKAMRDIETKYAPKKWGVVAGGGAMVATAGIALFMPSLAPYLGVTVPTVAAAVGTGTAAVGYVREKAGEIAEKRLTRKTLLGVLATLRPK